MDINNIITWFNIFIKMTFYHIKCYLNNYYYQYLTKSELRHFYHVDLSDILEKCIDRYNNQNNNQNNNKMGFIQINGVYRIYNCDNLDQTLETNTIDYNYHDSKFIYVSTNNNPDVLFLYNNGHIAFEEEILCRFGDILYDVLNEHFEHRWDGQIEIIKILKKKRL